MKLISGEELVAREVGDGKFDRPRVFQVTQTERGMGAALVPYFISDPDAVIEINVSCVVSTIDAPAQLEKAYLQQTSSLDLTTKI